MLNTLDNKQSMKTIKESRPKKELQKKELIPWDAQFRILIFFVFPTKLGAVKLENFRLNLRMNSLVVPY